MSLEIKPYLRRALAEYSGKSAESINLDLTLLDDLGLDSLDVVALAIDIEAAEGVEVNDHELGKAVTVRDVAALIDRLAESRRSLR